MTKIKPKSSWWVLRVVGFVVGFFDKAQRWQTTWVTIGGVVYHPDDVKNPRALVWQTVVAHESIHAKRQAASCLPWWLWVLAYLVFPLPMFFSWFRWREEREAFLVDIAYGLSVDEAVNQLTQYFRPWPRAWMRKWFESQLVI